MSAPDIPTVLVIEDDDDSRALLATLLTFHGFEVRTARNGLEGLRAARESKPCSILLDLHMPVMDGATFRREQLRDSELAEVPVICVSALSSRSPAARELGRVAFVQKPYDFGQLLDVIARMTGLWTRYPQSAALPDDRVH